MQLQPFALDSVPEADVWGRAPATTGGRHRSDVREGDSCSLGMRTTARARTSCHSRRTCDSPGGPSIQGLSVPRTNAYSPGRHRRPVGRAPSQEFDLLTGYLSYNGSAYQIKAGRMYRASGLGYYNFDGASAVWRGLGWNAVEGYAGWSLARGVKRTTER